MRDALARRQPEPPAAGEAKDAIARGGVPAPGDAAPGRRKAVLFLASAALAVAAAAVAAEIAAGPGTRVGWWPFATGFAILRWAAYAGLAAAALSVAAGSFAASGTKRSAAEAVAALGLIAGLAAAGVPWAYLRIAQAVPAIHDITTDTENPPSFAALLPARASSPNGERYAGAETAGKQRAAYPDVRPALIDVPPRVAFDRALAAARKMGWEIAAADREGGRIEATATTFWFGFKDDVVVRIGPEGSGSRVDVRSASRVGKSDIGANARRIREYLHTLTGVG